ncbi:MAG TPA: hypothetical protein VMB50_03320, partial [Myxococcales bacterium]|nr:hypothetical protein [Myxococcales bacterium]
EQELTEMEGGVAAELPPTVSLTINGVTMTGAQVDARFKSYLATFEAVDEAMKQYQTALAARRNIQLEVRDFYLQVKNAMIAYFGAQSPKLASFGIEPAKAKVTDSVKELLAAAKRQLTREARGTLGKKQKAAINPHVGTPAVVIDASGKRVIAPTVVDGVLPAVPGGTAPDAAGQGGE